MTAPEPSARCAMCGHETVLHHDMDQNDEGTPYGYCGASVDPDGCPCDGYAPPKEAP